MHIDIYSDVVCPWCYIGKKRLDQVLEGGHVEAGLGPRVAEGGGSLSIVQLQELALGGRRLLPPVI